jgi:hypothetical protein
MDATTDYASCNSNDDCSLQKKITQLRFNVKVFPEQVDF